jgi:hypothetical protein
VAHPLDLEFQPRVPLARPLAMGIFVAGLVVAAAAVGYEAKVQEESKALKARVLAAEARGASAVVTKGIRLPRPAAGDSGGRAAEVARELNLPWGSIFGAIERMAHPKVAIIGVQPDARKASVKLLAEAKSPGEMLEYVKALSEDKRFARIQLASHEVQTAVPGQPVRFVLVATLAGEG